MIVDVEREVAQRFGLGASAGPLVQAFLGLVETDFPGGWEGVVSRFRRQGYGLEVASWLGTGTPASVEAQSLDEVFGSETLAFLSERTGVNESTVAEVIAFILPTLVRRLKDPNGVGTRPPAWAAGTISTSHRPDLSEIEVEEIEPAPKELWVSPFVADPVAAESASATGLEIESAPDLALSSEHVNDEKRSPKGSAWNGWVTPLALAGVVAMISLFAARGGTFGNRSSVAEAKPATRVLSATANRQEGRLLPPSLTLRQVGGSWTFSGVVNRDEEKERLEEELQKLQARGAVDVDPGVDPSHWIPFIGELTRNVPRGLRFTFEGRKVTLSGLSDSELGRWAEVLQDRITRDLEVRVLDLDGNSADANKAVERELTRLETDSVSDPVQILNVLNKQVINFRSGSVVVPATNKVILERAGRLLAADESTGVIRIVGYTDSTGSASGNERISRRRADAVAKILSDVGVPSARIQAEGRGAERPIASNDTVEGRFKNRRIEFELGSN